MTTLYLDVETIPTQRADLMARIAAKHIDDPKKADEEHRKTSLNAAYGEIVCVCYAVDDEPVETLVRDWRQRDGEHKLLCDLVGVVRGLRDLTIVAHHAEFDRHFIRQRLAVHGVEAPKTLTGVGQKPWENAWQCTMAMWCGTPQGRISLSDLALALNLPGKDDLHGSKVWDAVLAGQTDLVVAHCRQDVECLRAVHRRLD
jgi:hypothetical protein